VFQKRKRKRIAFYSTGGDVRGAGARVVVVVVVVVVVAAAAAVVWNIRHG